MSKDNTKRNIRILKLIHNILKGSIPNFKSFKKKMKDEYGFDDYEIIEYYRLYIDNYLESGEYEKLPNLVEDSHNLFKSIKTVLDGNLSKDEIVKLFNRPEIIGDWFDRLSSERRSWRSTENTFDVDDKGIYLYLTDEDWGKYFSGMDDDDRYYYDKSQNSYYHSSYEELESDEFNYSLNGYPEEYRKNLADLASMVGDLNFADNVLNKNEEEGDFSEFLEKYFPDRYDRIVDDYLSSLGSLLDKTRTEGVKQCYDDYANYTSSGSDDVFIPWSNLLDIIQEKDIFTLSDLKDAEINGDGMGLSDCWWESYPSLNEHDEVYDELDMNVRELIDKLDDDDISPTLENSKKMWKTINDLGFEKIGGYYTKTSSEGIKFKILSTDPVENLSFNVNIIYPKKYSKSVWGGEKSETKNVYYEDLGSLISTIPLDRQKFSENYKNIIKKIIKQEKFSNRYLN